MGNFSEETIQRFGIENENDFSREHYVWSIWKVPIEKNKMWARL